MANPAQRPIRPDEAVDILRRLEPMLVSIQGEQAEIRKEQVEIRREQVEIRKEIGGLREAIAEIRGQLKYMPTLWQVAAAVGMINSLALALALGAVKLIQSVS